MLRNYLLTASRNLARHQFFTVINVLGLAIGMSISLLLIAMLSFIGRYDTFHVNGDRIYRIISQTQDPNGNEDLASTPALLRDKLKDGYTGIDQVVRVGSRFSGEAHYDTKTLPLKGYFVDPEFLRVFTFPLIKGNPATALEKANSLLITEAAASKVFGHEDPLGKVIMIGSMEYEITGLLKDHPKNSHMQFEMLAPYEAWLSIQRDDPMGARRNPWKEFRNSYVYVLLSEHTNPDQFQQFLNSISDDVYSHENNFKASFELQELADIMPGRGLRNQIGPDWDYAGLGFFVFLTFMILIPACFNYGTISISRALKRMKEIGLRKVMGGLRRQIFIQFITETVIITLTALILSFGIFMVIRQEFLSLLVPGQGLELEPDLPTLLYFLAFAVFVGLLAGAIPALYFSRLSPIDALKGKPQGAAFTSINFRKVLLVSQFALSLGFIMSVVVVLSQYRYTMNFDFGFQKANLLDIDLQGVNPESLQAEFSRLSSVQSVSLSSDILGASSLSTTWVKRPEKSDSMEVFQLFADDHYISNLGLTFLAGKNLPHQPVSSDVIVNEVFLKEFGLSSPLEALNQFFVLPGGQEVKVIGVLRNFHYMPLTEPVRSFFFRVDARQFRFANIKVLTSNPVETMKEMESVWKKLDDKKFTARFFGEEIEEAYSIYFSMVKIFGFLGFLAISISCLGLLGMVVFTVENRIKEIGIRKVMGATELNVTILLSGHFFRLMLIAALVAIPLTYFFFEQVYFRLQSYRVEIGFAEIGISLLVMLALGLATVLSQTIKAARANPVDALRTE